MKTLKITFLLFVACTSINLWADAKADVLAKLAEIPNAPMVITMDQAAGSPTVMLTDKGAIINKAADPIPFDQILTKLAALPKTAWPNGRVVFYSISATAPTQDISDKVEADLASANIRLLHP